MTTGTMTTKTTAVLPYADLRDEYIEASPCHVGFRCIVRVAA
jgi:hypothetical protein